MSAEIGVGPSIESGSHTCNGTCADLPMAPTNNRMQITDMMFLYAELFDMQASGYR